jgi:hypothetical protein
MRARTLGEVLDAQREKRSAPIRVEEESRSRPPFHHGHGQRLVGELLVQDGSHCPADNAAGVEIEHDRQMEPALAGAHRGDVGDPALIGGRGRKVAPQAVWWCRELAPGGGDPPEAPLGAGDDPLVPHEARDAMAPRRHALSPKLVVNARRPIRSTAGRVRRPDVDQERVVALGLARPWAPHPGVEAAGRHAEHPTEGPHAKFGAVSRDEVELHRWSSAK